MALATKALSHRHLELVYFVVLAGMVAVGLDQVAFNGLLKDWLPVSINDVTILAIVFTLPHIIASMLILLEPEYLEFYGSKLRFSFIGVVFLLLGAGLVHEFALAGVFAIATVVHVVFQQTGICQLVGLRQLKTFTVWKWLLAAFSLLIYLQLLSDAVGQLVLVSTIIFGLASTVALTIAVYQTGPQVGVRYAMWTQLMAISVAVCFWLGYPLIAVLMPRVVHDLTAFLIYINHDLSLIHI